MTDFASMLSTLRAEGDYKNTTMSSQAAILGITQEEFQAWEKADLPPEPGWAEKVKEHYHLSDREFELRLRISSEQALFAASDDELNPCGLFIRDLCQKKNLTMKDLNRETFFGFSYINSMCFGLRPVEETFIKQVVQTFGVSVPSYLTEFIERQDFVEMSLFGRTLKQRVVLHFCPGALASMNVVKLATVEEYLDSIPKDAKKGDAQTPLVQYILQKLAHGQQSGLTRVLMCANLNRSRIESIRAGNKVLSADEINTIADALMLDPLKREALQYMNALSAPVLDAGRLMDELSKRHEAVISKVISTVPYMTDEQATKLLEMCWLPANEAIPPTVRVRASERAPRFSQPKTPMMMFLYSENESMTPADIQEKLGIHYTTYLRRSLGRVNTSLSGFKKMCSVFKMDDIDQELLRHYCTLSRTLQHLYLVDCGLEQRLMAAELQSTISTLSDEDAKAIRAILSKYM